MAPDRTPRPEAAALRLFIAVDVPEDVRATIEDALGPIRERHPTARWVPTVNQHVTVKFLGRTRTEHLSAVTETVHRIGAAHAPFRTRTTGLGTFPSGRRARVLWVGLEDPSARLAAIAAGLDEALAGGVSAEHRAFTPHLTVARFDPPVALAGEIEDLIGSGGPFPIDRLVLYRSHLRRPAPIYEPLAVAPLVGDPERGD